MKERMQNLELIKLFEADMRKDVKDINVLPQNESTISFEIVYEWYIEAEKLIRVLANILTEPMFQAINQLRYAGHHVLKAQVDEEQRQQNIIEGYKHCKRAVYDSLDFYVYKLSADYRRLLPVLEPEKASKIEGLLKKHIIEINQCRMAAKSRIEYYSGIQETLIDGLNLIEQINIIQRERDRRG